MDTFDSQRLVALRRLCQRWDERATMELPARQFDAYLTERERAEWRATLAERRSIKAEGVAAQLTGEGATYWERLTHLYAQSGRMRTERDERAFWNSVQDLWGEFEALPPEHAYNFRSADRTSWHDLPITMGYDFQVVQKGSHFLPWWDHPVASTQSEMAQSVIRRLEPPAQKQPAQQQASAPTAANKALYQIRRRHSR